MMQPNGAGREPRNVFEREKTVTDWDADYYHPIAVRYYDKAVAEMLEVMGVRAGDTVLDAGCGPGVHSVRAAKYGATVRAVDLSETMLSHARARASAAGVAERITFSQDDLTHLSLDSAAFKYVFSWGVLIHVPDAENAIAHLARVTSPGGRLALHVLNASSIDFKVERMFRSLLRRPLKDAQLTSLGTGNWYGFNDDRLWVQRFATEQLVRALALHGMRLTVRRGAEFSELQRRVPRLLRPLLLLANSLAYSLRLPASWFCTHILVFEKA
ncbi:MAG TPA: class I SAM-dependent methyltransferase [Burkholderiaceae bacterium]|nr:class I SAM-dependent methyltransferase [Burkholderiaceae bacterium]